MASSYIGTVLCLANSRKMSGRCVAGKAITPKGAGDWIRPVSSRPDKELSASDRHYAGGAEPALLDVINIQFLGHDPHPYQPENHLIDDNVYWGFSRRASFAEALAAADPVQTDLWGLSPDSSYHGEYDRVLLADAPAFHSSLKLIRVNDLNVHVSAEGRNFGDMKKKLRGYFTYSGHRYALTITDPLISAQYLPQAEGWFSIGEALICASLGEPYKGHAYKLIAGVILP